MPLSQVALLRLASQPEAKYDEHMSDLGPEGFAPEEGIAGAPEELSEEAKQRFAAAAAALQQIRKEERKAKKKDDQVAQVIIQFLSDKRFSHLFLLISRLVARNCPSIFLLSILSLIHEESLSTVRAYLKEHTGDTEEHLMDKGLSLTKNHNLDDTANTELLDWVARMQMVLSLDPEGILLRLMIDEKNIDGSVLQLATFVLQEFFHKQQKQVPFEKVHPLTANILQSVFEAFIARGRKALKKVDRNTESTEE